jgi:hypothetical protein
MREGKAAWAAKCLPDGVCHTVEVAVKPHQRPSIERLQVQGGIVQGFL